MQFIPAKWVEFAVANRPIVVRSYEILPFRGVSPLTSALRVVRGLRELQIAQMRLFHAS